MFIAMIETKVYPTEFLGLFSTRERAENALREFQRTASYCVVNEALVLYECELDQPTFVAQRME